MIVDSAAGATDPYRANSNGFATVVIQPRCQLRKTHRITEYFLRIGGNEMGIYGRHDQGLHRKHPFVDKSAITYTICFGASSE